MQDLGTDLAVRLFDMGANDMSVIVAPLIPPTPDATTQQYADLIYNAVLNSNWRVLAALALIGVVACIRWLAPKMHNKLGVFLNSDRGGVVLVILGGLGGALSTAVFAGKLITGHLIVNGLVVGFIAAGGWNVIKKLTNPVSTTSTTTVMETKEEIIVKNSPLLVLVCLTFLGLTASCAPMSVDMKTYTNNLQACLIADGLDQASPLGMKIWRILQSNGFNSAQEVEASIESALIAVGGQGVEDVATCAVQSWFVQHPVAASATPTPSQAAARVYFAKHLPSTVRVSNATVKYQAGAK